MIQGEHRSRYPVIHDEPAENARNGAFDHTTMLAVEDEDEDEDEVALTPVPGIVENVKPELMEPMRSLGRMSLLDGGPASVRESDYVLNIAGVHEDALTRDWGAGVAAQASQFVRDCPVRSSLVGNRWAPRSQRS